MEKAAMDIKKNAETTVLKLSFHIQGNGFCCWRVPLINKKLFVPIMEFL